MSIESQGNAPPNGAQGSGLPEGSNQQQPAGMTADEFNKAFSAREKALQARFAKEQAEREAALEQKFSESFGKMLEEKLKPKDEPKQPKPGETPALTKLEDHPEWKAQQEKLAQLEKDARKATAERDREREKNRSGHLRTSAQEALTKIGVRPGAMKGAMALLINAEQRIGFSDGGKGDQIVWHDENGIEVPLEQGLTTWAKAEGKEYLPPLNPGGSGGGPGRGPGNGAATSTDDILGRAFLAHAKGEIQ